MEHYLREPVAGPLVGKNIKLEFESVMTTTWREWWSRHPDTLVLSLDTGHGRDYGEGVAYDFYFGTDALMFRTSYDDKRLKNKQEVLALRFPAAPNQQLAIDYCIPEKNPTYSNKIGAQTFVVLTDKSGANRMYGAQNIRFIDYDGNHALTDEHHRQWHLSESGPVSKNQRTLPRLPYHRAFCLAGSLPTQKQR